MMKPNIITSIEPMCSLYNLRTSKVNKPITILEVLHGIKTGNIAGFDLKPQIQNIRIEKDKEKKTILKSSLLAITFGGVFEDTRKSGILSSSGLIILDFDHVSDLNEVKQKISNLLFVLSVFVSPSGDGLKVLVKSNLRNSDEYKAIALSLFAYFEKEIGIKADTTKQNLNDLCYGSYDPEIYINESASEYEFIPIESKIDLHAYSKDIEQKKSKIEPLVSELLGRSIDITINYSDWRNIGFAFANFLGEHGRDFFHKVSSINPEYDIKKCNKQYNNCLSSNGEGITIKTFYYLVSKHGIASNELNNGLTQVKFFKKDKNDSYFLDTAELFDFLYNEGFRKYYPKGNENSIFILIKNNIIKKINKEFITEHCFNTIELLDRSEEIIKKMKNAFYAKSTSLSDSNLLTLKSFDGFILKDTKTQVNLYFKNCICSISPENIEITSYDELKGYIWDTKIIQKNFSLDIDLGQSSEIKDFLMDVCTVDEPKQHELKFKSLCSILGYLIHDYKDPSNAKAIILGDDNDSDEPMGGKGKGIISKLLSHIVNTITEDGKSFSNKSEFSFSQVSHDTKVLIIDDIPEIFYFTDFFSIITNGITINKKYQGKFRLEFDDSPKLMLTTNYSLLGGGDSHERRKVEFDLSNFYSIHNTPEQRFGHLLFNEWDNEEWNSFYNFICTIIQDYLKSGLIEPDNANIQNKKLKSFVGEVLINFIERNIPIGKKLNKKGLFSQYCEENKFTNRIHSQKIFTRKLRYYAQAKNLIMEEYKSDKSLTFEFLERS